MKILFLLPYPVGQAPSQRFRFEQYFGALRAQGHSYQVQSFLTSINWKLFYHQGKAVNKITALLGGYFRRLFVLFRILSYDFVFVHRETTPLGPPVIEWVLAKVFKKKMIYDFDDAIWLTDRKNESVIFKLFKFRSKVSAVCKWSFKVSCGNDYLCSYAKRFNPNVIYNPTTIDTENLHNPSLYPKQVNQKIIIGWTGSHSTLKYLEELEPILQVLETKYPQLELWIIADKPANLKIKKMYFKPWSLETEISDLARFDIGIMPLPDDEWGKGKCGFKALQYMALEIPTIASPVGVNNMIIENGENGYLCSTPVDWQTRLEFMIEHPGSRQKIGRAGRATVIERYSVLSNSNNFISLFQ